MIVPCRDYWRINAENYIFALVKRSCRCHKWMRPKSLEYNREKDRALPAVKIIHQMRKYKIIPLPNTVYYNNIHCWTVRVPMIKHFNWHRKGGRRWKKIYVNFTIYTIKPHVPSLNTFVDCNFILLHRLDEEKKHTTTTTNLNFVHFIIGFLFWNMRPLRVTGAFNHLQPNQRRQKEKQLKHWT